ncbi:hypothetical protein cypCar_00023497 [Cyprinus carpio]|nr:hypothetical protein cypCar_00023497 [Cyprinus carpio]
MSGHDDTRVEWHGWYRLFINGSSAQMPEWCFSYMSCGGFSSLWLGDPHPQPEDGVVTREVYGSVNDQCSYYRSDPIQVKACPGNYYVYRLLRPKPSIPVPVYCAVLFNTPNTDPCYDYTSLDDPWRATDNYYNNYMCDYNVNWNGWYRLFYNGQSVQMPESSVGYGMCGTSYPLWLNGPHPQLEDGVVTRQVCGSTWNDGCGYKSHPIQVKACPGNYFVYEFVRPTFCGSYCADVTKLASTTTSETTVTIPPIESSTLSITTPAEAIPFDPCYNYTVLDDSWRSTSNHHSSSILCDVYVSWVGWYRLFIGGQSAQMPDTCVDKYSCSTHAPLWLNGQHPQVEDGVVTRNICGHWGNDCCYFQSNPIKVKACPGNYYVYEFVQPNFCYGTYCAVAFNNISNDPCYNYETLDRPWRATNETGLYICDENFSWNGWYRLFYNGMDIRMQESCVNAGSCNAYSGLWLNGPHPQIEDGVVTIEICGGTHYGCCDFKSTPIRVKACPGDYYVYELVKPHSFWCSGYCTDTSTISTTFSSTSPATFIGSSMSRFKLK